MNSHLVHTDVGDHVRLPSVETIYHDIGHALGRVLGEYLHTYQISQSRGDVVDGAVTDMRMTPSDPHLGECDHEEDHDPTDQVQDTGLDHQSSLGRLSHSPHVQQRLKYPSRRVARPTRYLQSEDVEHAAIPLLRTSTTIDESVSIASSSSTRNSRNTRSQSRLAELPETCMVPSRWGPFPMRRELAAELKVFHPEHWGVPSHIPHHEEVVVCDRRWIVKQSTLHPSVGLGLFSCQDIDLPQFPRQVDKKALFPYCGMYYPLSKWNVLSRCHPTFRMYCVSADSYPEEDG